MSSDRFVWAALLCLGEVLGAIRPASTMVVVTGLLDPRWRLEIEAEAILDDAAEPSDDTGIG